MSSAHSSAHLRPEIVARGKADAYYHSSSVASKYHIGTRKTQDELTDVALCHLKRLRSESVGTGSSLLALDLGCGTGLSSERYVKAEPQAFLIGCDLSREMLEVGTTARRRMDRVQLSFFQQMPFRSDIFDETISISAVQWLISEEKILKEKEDKDERCSFAANTKRCADFFCELLRISPLRGALQLYPPKGQPHLLSLFLAPFEKSFRYAAKIYIEYPHKESKKKLYLCYNEKENHLNAKKLSEETEQKKSWCALCWPHCDACCGLNVSEDGPQHRLRAVREHELAFKTYVRSMARLVTLVWSSQICAGRDSKRRKVEDSPTHYKLKLEKKCEKDESSLNVVFERIQKELGPAGICTAFSIYRQLAKEAGGLGDGHTAPPTAQVLMKLLSSSERKMHLLHECPTRELERAPETQLSVEDVFCLEDVRTWLSSDRSKILASSE